MFYLPTLPILILGLVAASNLLLGALVYFNDTKSSTRRYFFLLNIAIVVFSIATYTSYQIQNAEYSIWLLRSVMFTAVPFAMYFFLLSKNFPGDQEEFSKKDLYKIYAWSAFTMLVTMSPLVFQGVELDRNGHIQPTVGYGMPIFAVTVLFYDLSGLWIILKKTIKAKAEERKPYLSMLMGFLIMLLLILIFNFLFPTYLKNISVIPYSITFSLPFVILTAYAIIKQHLLNIQVIATEVTTFLLVVATLLEVLFSDGVVETVLRLSIFLLVLSFAVLLIKGLRTEARQKQELEKLSKELSTANDQLKELDAEKSEFLSVASHQLRTPLTAIKGYTSMLLEGDFGPMPDVQKENIKVIFDSSQRLATLVTDLLDLSRIESGRMEFEFEAVNLCQIIDSVIEEISPKAKAHGLYVFFDNINRACPDIKADKEKLRQVVINLIDNAIKYTPKGGVTITLHRMDGQLLLDIKDTGIGIDPAQKEHLFEKFFRTKEANELTREGSGLGIYVVKKIVEAHGGKISFDSKGVGQGTTFSVTLPVPKGKIVPERVKIDSLF